MDELVGVLWPDADAGPWHVVARWRLLEDGWTVVGYGVEPMGSADGTALRTADMRAIKWAEIRETTAAELRTRLAASLPPAPTTNYRERLAQRMRDLEEAEQLGAPRIGRPPLPPTRYAEVGRVYAAAIGEGQASPALP